MSGWVAGQNRSAGGVAIVAAMYATGGAGPNPPTTVVGTPTSDTTYTITWVDASSDETSFTVQIRTADVGAGPGAWGNAAGAANPTAAGVQSFSGTGATGATVYDARVKASNGSGDSAWVESAAPFTTDNPGGGGGGVPQYADLTLSAAVQIARAAAASVAAAVQQQRSATAQAAAAIQAARSSSAAVVAALQAGRTSSTGLASAVQAAYSASSVLQAFLATAGTTVSVSLAAALQRQVAATASLAAALQTPRSTSATLAAAVASTLGASANLSAQLAIWRSATASLSVSIDGPTDAVMQASVAPQRRRAVSGARPAQRSTAKR